MVKKVIAFGCWNNERNIAVKNQAGKLHPMLLTSEKAARDHYKERDLDDPIVRVTVELIENTTTGEPDVT